MTDLSPEDKDDIGTMRLKHNQGDPVPEVVMQAALRFVRRHYGKGRIPTPPAEWLEAK